MNFNRIMSFPGKHILLFLGQASLFVWLGWGPESVDPSDDSPALSASREATVLAARFEQLLSATTQGEPVWSEPSAPVEGQWRYDVFTPPRIFRNPLTGIFEPTAFQFDASEAPIILNLQGVRYPEFRFQLVGFVEEASRSLSGVVLLIEDRETGRTHRVRYEQGAPFGEAYHMEALSMGRSAPESGTVTREARLILRRLDGSEISLHSASIARSPEPVLQLELGEQDFEIHKENATVTVGSYEITWIRTLDSPSIAFECSVTDLHSSVEQKFTLTAPAHHE